MAVEMRGYSYTASATPQLHSTSLMATPTPYWIYNGGLLMKVTILFIYNCMFVCNLVTVFKVNVLFVLKYYTD